MHQKLRIGCSKSSLPQNILIIDEKWVVMDELHPK
jgi:hypothetical protein